MSEETQSIGFSGRDQVSVSYEWKGDKLAISKVEMKGTLAFLRETKELLSKEIQGRSRDEIKKLLKRADQPLSPLFVELLELLIGQCTRPYQDEELCHCRVVPTKKVIEAIHYGATSTAEIARRTSAGTGCGTCQVQSEKLIQFYLKKA